MTYLSIGLALFVAGLALRLYGLRGEVAKAKELVTAREAERDAVLARLTAEEDKRRRAEDMVVSRTKEIDRLRKILRNSASDAALEELMKDELGG